MYLDQVLTVAPFVVSLSNHFFVMAEANARQPFDELRANGLSVACLGESQRCSDRVCDRLRSW